MAFALLAASSLGLLIVPSFAMSRIWLKQNAHFALAGAGFIWWLLAAHGWLGLLVVLAAVWLAVMPARIQRFPNSPSTIVRRQAPVPA
jgi:hypothetical protein